MTKFVRPQALRNIRTIAGLSAIALLVSAASVAANPASGQAKPDGSHQGRHQGHGNGARLFERWDKDNDGRITIAELPARMKTHMTAIDQNKDGILTKDEFEQGKAQLKAMREKEFDKNGDGKVSDEERREAMRARVVERFVEQDKNHDGALVESEIQKPGWDRMRAADANSDSRVTLDELKTAFDEGKLRPGPGGRGPKSEADMKAHAQQRFNADDKNRDGYLTEAEVPKQKWEHIKLADANRDNRVSFDELTAAFKAGKMGHPGNHRGHGQAGGNQPGPRQ
jgi:Ca2+-binding EF-hand superfamily protein